MKFRIGESVAWKWMGRKIEGVVKEVFEKSVTKIIKGKAIKRNGTSEKPAYLVESKAGNLALKLETELEGQAPLKSKKTPKMFG